MAADDDLTVVQYDAAALARRVAALEKVVEMERRLRRQQAAAMQAGDMQAVAMQAVDMQAGGTQAGGTQAGDMQTAGIQAGGLEHVVAQADTSPGQVQGAPMPTAPMPTAPMPAVPMSAAQAFGPGEDDRTVLHRAAPGDDATVLVTTALPTQAHTAPPQPIGHAMPAEALALASGVRLLEYRIDGVLGQGGFGITYLATDIQLHAKVAIKEYLPAGVAQRANDRSVAPRWADDVEIYQRGLDSFLVEARTLATFRHPNIVRVARFFEANRTAYMVLEYERGRSLRAWWKKAKSMPEQDLLNLFEPLLDGLGVVHAAGFLHRDIKPDNVVVRKEDGSLVLLDFGAARATVGPAGALDQVVTPGYAPPEQYGNGAQGPWTDIYALGAMLYWMITGSKPPAAPARASGEAAMVPARDAGGGRFSPAFLGAIDWALELDPAARPQTLQEWAQELFASHTGRMSLQDALFASDADGRSLGRESLRVLRGSSKAITQRSRQLSRAMLHPASWPMVVKMTLAMVVAALAPMMITAYYNLHGSVDALSAGELRNLERLAHSTAGRIGQVIADSQTLANYMASDADVAAFLRQRDPASQAAVQYKLNKLFEINPDVNLAYVMDTEGRALLSTDARMVGRSFAFRQYFREAMQGHAYKTGIMVSSTTGKPGLYFANPIFGEDRRVTGVLVIQIKSSSFVATLESVGVGTARSAFMIDGDGVLIHFPDPKRLYTSLMPLPDYVQQKIVQERRFAKAQIESLDMPQLAAALVRARKPGHVSYHSTLYGRDEYAGYAPVPAHDWVVCVTEPRAAFEAPLHELFSNVRSSVALVGLVFLVFAVLFARSIVRPIGRLTDAADALKKGDYENATIHVSSNDEIGRLARTFNVLIDVLRQRERERRTGGRRNGRR
jgi:serine/threonine protein kinase/HAMP domain-containing protein